MAYNEYIAGNPAGDHPEETMSENIYTQNGFSNRQAYLDNLAENYGNVVYTLAEVLGPSEDFDGLVTECEDYSDMYEE